MKNRKGYMRLYSDDDTYTDVPISDQEPEPGEFRLYACWGNEPWREIKKKSAANNPRALNYRVRWERSQRVLTERTYQKGPAAAGKNRTQLAAEYWKPYQAMYHQLRSEGMSIGKARYAVLKQIRADGSWPPNYLEKRKDNSTEPSQNTLDTWLKD